MSVSLWEGVSLSRVWVHVALAGLEALTIIVVLLYAAPAAHLTGAELAAVLIIWSVANAARAVSVAYRAGQLTVSGAPGVAPK